MSTSHLARARACGGLGVLLALHCGSSPEPVYYALRATHATSPAPRSGESTGSWAHLVKLRRPSIAGYLDRAEVVRRVEEYRLSVASGDSWSEPLGDMIGRVLAEDLADRLGGGSVVFGEASPISSAPDAVVSLDVQRFDIGEDGTLALHGEVAVERAVDHVTITVRTIDLRLRPTSTSTPALVAAMSQLVSALADEVARALRSGHG